MTGLKRYLTVVTVSSHELEKIVNVLARARDHMAHGRYSLAAELIKKAEKDLETLMGVEDEQP